MPKMARPKSREQLRTRRHFRVRKKVIGSAERPRLVVYRSLKHIYAQLVDDAAQRTLMTVTDTGLEGKKTEKSVEVGKRIAAKAKDAGVTRVVFDRAGYKYHGRVKACGRRSPRRRVGVLINGRKRESEARRQSPAARRPPAAQERPRTGGSARSGGGAGGRGGRGGGGRGGPGGGGGGPRRWTRRSGRRRWWRRSGRRRRARRRRSARRSRRR